MHYRHITYLKIDYLLYVPKVSKLFELDYTLGSRYKYILLIMNALVISIVPKILITSTAQSYSL